MAGVLIYAYYAKIKDDQKPLPQGGGFNIEDLML